MAVQVIQSFCDVRNWQRIEPQVCMTSSTMRFTQTTATSLASCCRFQGIKRNQLVLSVSFSKSISSVEQLHSLAESGQRCAVDGGAARAAGLLNIFGGGKKSQEKIKMELLSAIAPLARGAKANADDIATVDEIVQELEKLNPTKDPLNSSFVNGKWKLIYTTSESVLQKKRPELLRPRGPIYQAINTDTLRAQNFETWPFFNQVTADLEPLGGGRVLINFDYFRIGGLFCLSRPENTPVGFCRCLSMARPTIDEREVISREVSLGKGNACLTSELNFEGCKNDLEQASEPILFHSSDPRWCGLCGSGNGRLICGSCFGDGSYATRLGLSGIKGKVGWARCKTCSGKKTIACPLCRPSI